MEEYWRWFMYQTKILPEQRVKCLEYFETPENMFIAPAAKVEKAEFLSEAAREELKEPGQRGSFPRGKGAAGKRDRLLFHGASCLSGPVKRDSPCTLRPFCERKAPSV